MKTQAAVGYAAGKPLEVVTVDLDGPRDGEVLRLEVYNDGPALGEDYQPGVGLNNAQRRLAALYGEASSLALSNLAGGVQASISLPYRIT